MHALGFFKQNVLLLEYTIPATPYLDQAVVRPCGHVAPDAVKRHAVHRRTVPPQRLLVLQHACSTSSSGTVSGNGEGGCARRRRMPRT